jgi:AraC-like DNA-binding protein
MSIASAIPIGLSRGFHQRLRFLGAAGTQAIAACFFQRHGDASSHDVQIYPMRTLDRLPHDYGCYGLSYMLEGQGVYVDPSRRRIPVSAGDFLQFTMKSVYGKSRPHLEVTGALFECGIHFSVDLGRKLEEAGIWNPLLQRIENVIDPSIADRFVRFYDHLADQSLTSGAIVRDAVGIIDLVYSRLEPRPPVDNRMTRACQLLSEHPEPSYAVAKVAQAMRMTYATFRRRFTRRMGIPPHAYQLQQRINLACGLLDRLSVKVVAFRLGYKNESAFSKQFKKVVGQSPSAFRRRIARG